MDIPENELYLVSLANRLYFYIAITFTPMSIAGNLITFLIYFTTKSLRIQSISVYYCFKAIIDIAIMLIVSLSQIQSLYYSTQITASLCGFYITIEKILKNTSSFLLVFASIDRLRVFVLPFRFRFMRILAVQVVCICSVMVIFTTVYLPLGLNFIILTDNETYGLCSLQSPELLNAYDWVFLTYYVLLPSFIMMCCSIKFAFILNSIKQTLNTNSTLRQLIDEKKLLVNLIGMVCLYFCTTFPFAFMSLFNSLQLNSSPENIGKINLTYTCTLCVSLINYTFQIFVHLKTNQTFYMRFKSAVMKENRVENLAPDIVFYLNDKAMNKELDEDI